jgi:DNA polymerase (family X)
MTAMSNREMAGEFEKLADLLEMEGANPFRVRAYRNAARVVGDLGEEVAALLGRGEDVAGLEGIGRDLAEKIEGLVKTGLLPALEEMHGQIPPTIHEVLRLPGLGPKKVGVIFRELGVSDLDGLEKAAREGRVRGLAGLGEKTEANILKAIVRRREVAGRFLRARVREEADGLLAVLRGGDGDARLEVAGSYRRGRETVGDLDILAVSAGSEALMDALVGYERVEDVLARGSTKSSVVLGSGLQVDLRVVAEEAFGAALHYFTGSKAHNIAVRRRAQQLGLKVNEYGVYHGDERIAGDAEESVFGALGLAWIPPELREDRGEVEAAEADALPRLVERGDLRGDLHSHTTASDGRHSLAAMAAAARKAGLTYLAVTDHSQRLTVANGLDADRLLRQIDEIDRVNETLKGITLLKGSEVDILEDGELDLPDEVLSRLDLVVCSVHSQFGLSRERQTGRILRAMDHSYFSILAHPTGRILLTRDAYDVDVPRLIAHARERGCFLELNANPQRLDLHDVHVRMAKEAGVLVSIATDAHCTDDLANLEHGIAQARRGWLCREDVLNARPLAQVRKLLRKTMG